jgi:hypothetical protein
VDQAIRRLFHPDDEIPAAYRVNRAYSDQWHGVYDQRTDSVHFFVTTGSETVPKTGLVFSRERMQWTMNKYEQGIKASCQGRDANGEYRAWVADENGWVWALSGTRQCEGNSSGTLSGSVTSSTNSTVSDSGAAFNTTGNALAGVYVKVISATGTVQTRLITSNTGTQLTVSPNWTNNPDTTYTYIIGGVESIWRSVWHFIEPTPALNCKGIELLFLPASTARYVKVRLYKDFGSSPVLNWGMARVKDGLTIPLTVSTDGWMLVDSSYAKGRVRITFMEPFSTCFSVELSMLGANKPTLFRGYDLEAVSVPKEFE